MPQKITEQAKLLCDKGSKPSDLKVTSQSFCTAGDKLVATEQDNQPEANIPNFGNCNTTGKQCSPKKLTWQKTAQQDTIMNYKLLTEDSQCICSEGGKISVQDKGHQEKHEAVS